MSGSVYNGSDGGDDSYFEDTTRPQMQRGKRSWLSLWGATQPAEIQAAINPDGTGTRLIDDPPKILAVDPRDDCQVAPFNLQEWEAHKATQAEARFLAEYEARIAAIRAQQPEVLPSSIPAPPVNTNLGAGMDFEEPFHYANRGETLYRADTEVAPQPELIQNFYERRVKQAPILLPAPEVLAGDCRIANIPLQERIERVFYAPHIMGNLRLTDYADFTATTHEQKELIKAMFDRKSCARALLAYHWKQENFRMRACPLRQALQVKEEYFMMERLRECEREEQENARKDEKIDFTFLKLATKDEEALIKSEESFIQDIEKDAEHISECANISENYIERMGVSQIAAISKSRTAKVLDSESFVQVHGSLDSGSTDRKLITTKKMMRGDILLVEEALIICEMEFENVWRAFCEMKPDQREILKNHGDFHNMEQQEKDELIFLVQEKLKEEQQEAEILHAEMEAAEKFEKLYKDGAVPYSESDAEKKLSIQIKEIERNEHHRINTEKYFGAVKIPRVIFYSFDGVIYRDNNDNDQENSNENEKNIIEEEKENEELLIDEFVWFAAVLKGNAHATARHVQKFAFYPIGASANHSCQPNAIFRCVQDHLMYIAIRDLEEGEEIMITYCSELFASTAFRRKKLFANHGFVCQCKKCSLHTILDFNRDHFKVTYSNTSLNSVKKDSDNKVETEKPKKKRSTKIEVKKIEKVEKKEEIVKRDENLYEKGRNMKCKVCKYGNVPKAVQYMNIEKERILRETAFANNIHFPAIRGEENVNSKYLIEEIDFTSLDIIYLHQKYMNGRNVINYSHIENSNSGEENMHSENGDNLNVLSENGDNLNAHSEYGDNLHIKDEYLEKKQNSKEFIYTSKNNNKNQTVDKKTINLLRRQSTNINEGRGKEYCHKKLDEDYWYCDECDRKYSGRFMQVDMEEKLEKLYLYFKRTVLPAEEFFPLFEQSLRLVDDILGRFHWIYAGLCGIYVHYHCALHEVQVHDFEHVIEKASAFYDFIMMSAHDAIFSDLMPLINALIRICLLNGNWSYLRKLEKIGYIQYLKLANGEWDETYIAYEKAALYMKSQIPKLPRLSVLHHLAHASQRTPALDVVRRQKHQLELEALYREREKLRLGRQRLQIIRQLALMEKVELKVALQTFDQIQDHFKNLGFSLEDTLEAKKKTGYDFAAAHEELQSLRTQVEFQLESLNTRQLVSKAEKKADTDDPPDALASYFAHVYALEMNVPLPIHRLAPPNKYAGYSKPLPVSSSHEDNNNNGDDIYNYVENENNDRPQVRIDLEEDEYKSLNIQKVDGIVSAQGAVYSSTVRNPINFKPPILSQTGFPIYKKQDIEDTKQNFTCKKFYNDNLNSNNLHADSQTEGGNLNSHSESGGNLHANDTFDIKNNKSKSIEKTYQYKMNIPGLHGSLPGEMVTIQHLNQRTDGSVPPFPFFSSFFYVDSVQHEQAIQSQENADGAKIIIQQDEFAHPFVPDTAALLAERKRYIAKSAKAQTLANELGDDILPAATIENQLKPSYASDAKPIYQPDQYFKDIAKSNRAAEIANRPSINCSAPTCLLSAPAADIKSQTGQLHQNRTLGYAVKNGASLPNPKLVDYFEYNCDNSNLPLHMQTKGYYPHPPGTVELPAQYAAHGFPNPSQSKTNMQVQLTPNYSSDTSQPQPSFFPQ